eukprot:365159-Chlamydomonas_euryale.AAC.2
MSDGGVREYRMWMEANVMRTFWRGACEGSGTCAAAAHLCRDKYGLAGVACIQLLAAGRLALRPHPIAHRLAVVYQIRRCRDVQIDPAGWIRSRFDGMVYLMSESASQSGRAAHAGRACDGHSLRGVDIDHGNGHGDALVLSTLT